MLNISEIGKKINQRRKDLNMTQMELAEQLFVTHQAVSSWENGHTMPDITKLDDLCKVLQIDLQTLLGDGSKAVKKVIDKDESITIEEITEISQIIKPKEMEEMVEKKKGELNFSSLVSLAPFLESELLCSYIKDEKLSPSQVASLAPFIKSSELKQIILQSYIDKTIVMLAPFLSKTDLNDIIEQKNLVELFDSNDKNSKWIVQLAPFLSKDTLLKIVEKKPNLLFPFAPFIGKSNLSDFVKNESFSFNFDNTKKNMKSNVTIESLDSLKDKLDSNNLRDCIEETSYEIKDLLGFVKQLDEDDLIDLIERCEYSMDDLLLFQDYIDSENFGKLISKIHNLNISDLKKLASDKLLNSDSLAEALESIENIKLDDLLFFKDYLDSDVIGDLFKKMK